MNATIFTGQTGIQGLGWCHIGPRGGNSYKKLPQRMVLIDNDDGNAAVLVQKASATYGSPTKGVTISNRPKMMECGTCSVSGCAPSPELDLQDSFWLMQKNRHSRRTTRIKSSFLRIRILGETRNKSSAKKSFFRFSGARRFVVKSSRVYYDACCACHENTRRVHFTVFCQIYFA